MTGYGEAERDTPAGRLRLEVKTVNHRYFNAVVKTPPGFDRYERDLTETLRRHVSRGHVTASLTLQRVESDNGTDARLDMDRARRYHESLERLRTELGLPGEVDLGIVARFGDIFRGGEPNETPAVEVEVLLELADEAVQGAVALRTAEGERLRADLLERLDSMAAQIERVAERAPQRLSTERDRLRAAVRELTEQVEVDEDRLAREIAYLADKLDVSEEIVRFRSHLAAFREALDGSGAEPVGKRLGFLVQELHREANTIGSKANDAEMAGASVALREEIERVREQVENIE